MQTSSQEKIDLLLDSWKPSLEVRTKKPVVPEKSQKPRRSLRKTIVSLLSNPKIQYTRDDVDAVLGEDDAHRAAFWERHVYKHFWRWSRRLTESDYYSELYRHLMIFHYETLDQEIAYQEFLKQKHNGVRVSRLPIVKPEDILSRPRLYDSGTLRTVSDSPLVPIEHPKRRTPRPQS